eukprot:102885-Amphidinium_carterae.1
MNAGSKANRTQIGVITCLWRALGFPLAHRKSQYGTKVTWTSVIFTVGEQELKVEVKPAIVEEC